MRKLHYIAGTWTSEILHRQFPMYVHDSNGEHVPTPKEFVDDLFDQDSALNLADGDDTVIHPIKVGWGESDLHGIIGKYIHLLTKHVSEMLHANGIEVVDCRADINGFFFSFYPGESGNLAHHQVNALVNRYIGDLISDLYAIWSISKDKSDHYDPLHDADRLDQGGYHLD